MCVVALSLLVVGGVVGSLLYSCRLLVSFAGVVVVCGWYRVLSVVVSRVAVGLLLFAAVVVCCLSFVSVVVILCAVCWLLCVVCCVSSLVAVC